MISLLASVTALRKGSLRLFAAGLVTLAQPSLFVRAEASTSPLDPVVRSICMNDAMTFDERVRTLSALGWLPAGTLKDLQLFADLQARDQVQGAWYDETSDLQKEYEKFRAAFEKINAQSLGAPEGSVRRSVFLQSAAFPDLTLQLEQMRAAQDKTVDFCRFASQRPAEEFSQYIASVFLVAPSKQNVLGRHWSMTFVLTGDIQKEWVLTATESTSLDSDGPEPTLFSILFRTRER